MNTTVCEMGTNRVGTIKRENKKKLCIENQQEKKECKSMHVDYFITAFVFTWCASDVHGFKVACFYNVNSDGVSSRIITQRQEQISSTSLQIKHTQKKKSKEWCCVKKKLIAFINSYSNFHLKHIINFYIYSSN